MPGGLIWPPLEGRAFLMEALAGAAPVVERAPGQWMSENATGWRLYSSTTSPSTDEAHAALLQQARVHADLATVLSARRCIFVDHRHGHRLWQAVFQERSVWRAVSDALASRVPETITAELQHAARLCTRLETRWSTAPWSLPCTLETVGVEDAAFVSVVPDVDRLASGPSTDHRARILRQLRSLVARTFGDEANPWMRWLDG